MLARSNNNGNSGCNDRVAPGASGAVSKWKLLPLYQWPIGPTSKLLNDVTVDAYQQMGQKRKQSGAGPDSTTLARKR